MVPEGSFRAHTSPPLVSLLSHVNPVQNYPPYYFLILYSHLWLGPLSGLIFSRFPTKILYAFLISLRDISVGIALGYGLDDRFSRVRFLAGAANFSFHHHFQNGCGAHPTSYLMGTRSSFPGGKAAGAWSFLPLWKSNFGIPVRSSAFVLTCPGAHEYQSGVLTTQRCLWSWVWFPLEHVCACVLVFYHHQS
jgi:hypothetical protein